MGTYRGYRGNANRVMADASKIAKRLRKTSVTLTSLIKEYRCAYETMMRAIRSQISLWEWNKIRHEHLVRGNVKSRFQKGYPPWNKGLHYNPGGRSVETRFKKGHFSGQAARNWRPVRTITIRYDKPPKRLRNRKRKEGMPPWRGKPRRWIKVKDDGRPQDRWVSYARYLWQQQYGPVPTGYFIVHIDGDQMNDCLENLTVVDRRRHLALQMKRDPGHLVRCRTAAGKATRQRHETNRQKRRLYGPQQIIFECPACGAEYRGKKAPQRRRGTGVAMPALLEGYQEVTSLLPRLMLLSTFK